MPYTAFKNKTLCKVKFIFHLYEYLDVELYTFIFLLLFADEFATFYGYKNTLWEKKHAD